MLAEKAGGNVCPGTGVCRWWEAALLVVDVVVRGCVGRCGSTCGAVLAAHGVTVCEVLKKSYGWLVAVCCSWAVFLQSQSSPSGHPDSHVPFFWSADAKLERVSGR